MIGRVLWLGVVLTVACAGMTSSAAERPARPSGPAAGTPADPVWTPRTPYDPATSTPHRELHVESAAYPRPPSLTRSGIPLIALDAYRAAAELIAGSNSSCGLHWSLLAAIGRVESDHGRHGGSIIGLDGRVAPPIIGPALDGNGVALIRDSDGGRFDDDTVYDRAVGPMQFLPGTWRIVGVDGNDDGLARPGNMFDAALSAGRYLCAAGADLTDPSDRRAAVFRYNHSHSYVDLVLSLVEAYRAGDVPQRPVSTGARPPEPLGDEPPEATTGRPPAVDSKGGPSADPASAGTKPPAAAEGPPDGGSGPPSRGATWSPTPSTAATGRSPAAPLTVTPTPEAGEPSTPGPTSPSPTSSADPSTPTPGGDDSPTPSPTHTPTVTSTPTPSATPTSLAPSATPTSSAPSPTVSTTAASPQPPTVTSVDPRRVRPGAVLTVVGERFGTESTVTLGRDAAEHDADGGDPLALEPQYDEAENALEVTLPRELTEGRYLLTVITDGVASAPVPIELVEA